MEQGKDDKQLIAWLGRIQSIPRPVQALIIACLRLRDPLLADRIALSLASQRRLGDLLDQHALKVIAPDTHPVDTLTDSGGFLDVASRSGAATSRIGERIGPWRIVGLIGSGGMGSVYEAWRDDGQYEQKVALKCIRNDLFSPEMFQAFLGECNALAKLEHKGIVPLLDGGVDDRGIPWFVMRYVEGEAIDIWCDQHRLSIRDRVKLIVQACDALSFAHRRGILHGDIKPSNLLVTPEGEVLLVDFGLSVVLTGRQITEISGVSLGYSAPEGTSRVLLTTSVDVYSLGAVIYRVLGGEPPASPFLSTLWAEVDRPAATIDEIALSATRDTVVARKLHDNRRLAGILKGDLSAIASRCVAHDPDHRYPSIDALKEDLLRWLARRPVNARDGGLFHRLALLVSRQRVASALVLAFFAGAIAGAVVLTAKSRQATEEAASYAAMSGILEQTLGNATMSALGGVQYSPDAMLDQAEQQIRTLAQDKQPAVLARGLLILARSHSMAGNYKKALALVEEANRLLPDSTDTSVEIQATQAALTNIAGNCRKALEIAQSALLIFDQRRISNPPLRIQILIELARAQWGLGKLEEALRIVSDAIGMSEALPTSDTLIELLLVRGEWNTQLYAMEPANGDLRRALALAEGASPLVKARIQGSLSELLRKEGKPAEAADMAQQQLALIQSRLGKHHPLAGRSAVTLGRALFQKGDFPAARQALDEGLRISASNYGTDHPDTAYAALFAMMPKRIEMRGNTAEVNAETRRSLAILERHYGAGHPYVLEAKVLLAMGLTLESEEAARQNAPLLLADARNLLEEVMEEHRRKNVPPFPDTRIQLARIRLKQGTSEDILAAERLIRENESFLSAQRASGHPTRDANWSVLAEILNRKGASREADALAKKVVTNSREKLPSNNARILLFGMLMLRAKIAADEGEVWQARALLDEAESIARPFYGPDHTLIRELAHTRAELKL